MAVNSSTTTSNAEHWPRRVVRAFRDARPGRGSARAGGRPPGSGDIVSREQLLPRVDGLLQADPGVTAAAVTDELGVAMTTATTALATLRGRRIADLLEAEPDLVPGTAAERLGYPPITHRGALAAAQAEQRIRAARPYVHAVADALVSAGYGERAEPEVVELSSGALAAAVQLTEDQETPALVWHERFGWRTAASRRHPIGKDSGTRPEGEGIRYLAEQARPDPALVVAALGR